MSSYSSFSYWKIFPIIIVLISSIGIVGADTLAESDHPYANNYDNTWTITDPSATQMRIHFEKLDLVNVIGYPISDTVKLYDGNDTLLTTYSSDGEDFWSEWYMTDTIKVRLTTGASNTAWGFLVDDKDVRTGMTCPPTDPDALAESCHDYANNYDYTWTIIDPSATQMRIHFQKLDLVNLIGYPISDTVKLYDGNDTLLTTYSSDGEDFWSEWYMTDTIKVRLTTGASYNAWGFLVDEKDVRTGMTCPPTDPDALAESCHDYANNYDYTWTIIDPSATQMRIHFQKLDLVNLIGYPIGDTVKLYDGNDTLLVTYSSDGEDFWSEWYMTDTIKVRLTTDSSYTAWGFLVDDKDPPDPVAPDSVTDLHNTTYQQTSITWEWTDPVSTDFDHLMVYLDGIFQENVTNGVETFTASDLTSATSYEIGTRTVGTTGLINSTWVNNTATTAPEPPVQIPPASVTNLHNTTYQQTSITWEWTDPASPDFDHVMVYLDGVFQGNVTEGTETFIASSLNPTTSYTIGTRTVGSTGLINQTWVNHTAMTASSCSDPNFSITLNEGWNLFSTPVSLESGYTKFYQVFNASEQEKLLVLLGWDGSMWYIPSAETDLKPLDAYYLKVKEGMTAEAMLVPSEDITSLPTRYLPEGLNLIGPAPAYDSVLGEFPEMPLDQALISIEQIPGGGMGYIIVVSPGLNQPGWSYARGGTIYDLLPYKGYWVVMENTDTLYGFSTTPIL